MFEFLVSMAWIPQTETPVKSVHTEQEFRLWCIRACHVQQVNCLKNLDKTKVHIIHTCMLRSNPGEVFCNNLLVKVFEVKHVSENFDEVILSWVWMAQSISWSDRSSKEATRVKSIETCPSVSESRNSTCPSSPRNNNPQKKSRENKSEGDICTESGLKAHVLQTAKRSKNPKRFSGSTSYEDSDESVVSIAKIDQRPLPKVTTLQLGRTATVARHAMHELQTDPLHGPGPGAL